MGLESQILKFGANIQLIHSAGQNFVKNKNISCLKAKGGSLFLKIGNVPGSIHLLEGELHSEYHRGVEKPLYT